MSRERISLFSPIPSRYRLTRDLGQWLFRLSRRRITAHQSGNDRRSDASNACSAPGRNRSYKCTVQTTFASRHPTFRTTESRETRRPSDALRALPFAQHQQNAGAPDHVYGLYSIAKQRTKRLSFFRSQLDYQHPVSTAAPDVPKHSFRFWRKVLKSEDFEKDS
jgi:hypothetical protein